jgi:hypothetical protein
MPWCQVHIFGKGEACSHELLLRKGTEPFSMYHGIAVKACRSTRVDSVDARIELTPVVVFWMIMYQPVSIKHELSHSFWLGHPSYIKYIEFTPLNVFFQLS